MSNDSPIDFDELRVGCLKFKRAPTILSEDYNGQFEEVMNFVTSEQNNQTVMVIFSLHTN